MTEVQVFNLTSHIRKIRTREIITLTSLKKKQLWRETYRECYRMRSVQRWPRAGRSFRLCSGNHCGQLFTRPTRIWPARWRRCRAHQNRRFSLVDRPSLLGTYAMPHNRVESQSCISVRTSVIISHRRLIHPGLYGSTFGKYIIYLLIIFRSSFAVYFENIAVHIFPCSLRSFNVFASISAR